MCESIKTCKSHTGSSFINWTDLFSFLLWHYGIICLLFSPSPLMEQNFFLYLSNSFALVSSQLCVSLCLGVIYYWASFSFTLSVYHCCSIYSRYMWIPQKGSSHEAEQRGDGLTENCVILNVTYCLLLFSIELTHWSLVCPLWTHFKSKKRQNKGKALRSCGDAWSLSYAGMVVLFGD